MYYLTHAAYTFTLGGMSGCLAILHTEYEAAHCLPQRQETTGSSTTPSQSLIPEHGDLHVSTRALMFTHTLTVQMFSHDHSLYCHRLHTHARALPCRGG